MLPTLIHDPDAADAVTDRGTERRRLHSQINALRPVDSITNWFYLAREYVLLATIAGAAIYFHQHYAAWNVSGLWLIPVFAVAVALMGAVQHRLVTLGHEGSHYLLFRNRVLNEVASNWFCFYPFFSTVHNYRLQHMAHHQFANVPGRDPDLAPLQATGIRFRHPCGRSWLLRECLLKPALWLPGHLKYTLARARMSMIGDHGGNFAVLRKRSRIVTAWSAVLLSALAASLLCGRLRGNLWLVSLAPVAAVGLTLAFAAWSPASWYPETRIRCDLPLRWEHAMRILYCVLLFSAISWLTCWTRRPWLLYYLLLWVLPIVTSFAYCMELRSFIQHIGTGVGRGADTRNFHGARLIRAVLFPYRMDLHVEHHLYPFVPHDCLQDLHRLLMGDEEYRERLEVYDFRDALSSRPPNRPESRG